jgi:hypothetical protein
MRSTAAIFLLFLLPFSLISKPKKQKKVRFPFGTWMRSQEEDKDPNASWLLYRPDSFSFPPARGRSGISVQKDGRFALIGPSAVDGRDTSWGSWKQDGRQTFQIAVEGSAFQRLSWKTAGKGRLLIELK